MLDVPPEREMAECCRKGNDDRVAELLDWGVDPGGQVDGKRFLELAIASGHAAIVRRLIRAGAKVHPTDLPVAVQSGSVPAANLVADELFFAGQELVFWTEGVPLLCKPGFLASASPRMVRWMIEQGADPHEADMYGRGPLDVARRDEVDPEILALLDRG